MPIIVVTAKDLSPSEHEMLNGHVRRVLQKASFRREDVLLEVRRALAAA